MSIEFRTVNGLGNNIANPTWGEAETELLRLVTPAYEDGISEPRGGFVSTLPSPRAISNAVSTQSGPIPADEGTSDWIWQWGQFLDHDLDLTEGANPAEPFNIPVPTGDPFFDPFNTGTQEIDLNRSAFDSANPREQTNAITSFIDGSNVYGSEDPRAIALRASDGTGKLLTSVAGNGEVLLPLNPDGLPNEAGPTLDLAETFLAGDVRANEQIGLTAAHTLFVREHNRLADEIKARLDAGETELVDARDAAIAEADNGVANEGDFIYEAARIVVGAQQQKITYEEYLPLLIGVDLTASFTGYDDTVNASVSNEFSTGVFRLGHTQLAPELRLADENGTSSISLRDAFFDLDPIKDDGVDSILAGFTLQTAQEVDTFVIDDVRNFLFGPPGAGGFDLVSLNLQRGRDHGLPALNDVRDGLGLTPHASFLELTGGDAVLAANFASVYASVDDVDLWIGGLGEAEFSGLVGETFFTILEDQFVRSSLGDRFFYLNDEQLEIIELIDPDFSETTLANVIRDNVSVADSYLVSDNAFITPFENEFFGGDSGSTLRGTGRADLVDGQDGGDEIRGGAGADILLGGLGDDTVRGNGGNDRVLGGIGNDSLRGDGGNDTVVGGADDDILKGGGGNDLIDGGTGNDTANGGGGSDTFVFASDLIDGISDTDTINKFRANDLLDFSDYLGAGGTVGFTRTGNKSLEVDLSGEDTVLISGTKSGIDAAEAQLSGL